MVASPAEPNGVPVESTTDTPFPFRRGGRADAAVLSDEAAATLELGTALDLVAGHAVNEGAKARIRARRPTVDVAWIRAQLGDVEEATTLVHRRRDPTVPAVPDLTDLLARLRIPGGVLDGSQLAQIGRLLGAARDLIRDVRQAAEEAPRLAAFLRPPPDPRLAERLGHALDDDGNVLDRASPALASARRTVQSSRARLVKRLESLARAAAGGGDGGGVTIRGGRYVIPVRRDDRSRPSGIVHDESASQGTLFIEPTETIELGNALRAAEGDEQREVVRVLRSLTEAARAEHPALEDAFEMVLDVDELLARGAYSAVAEGHAPSVAAVPAPLVIVAGRHPLLVGGPDPVVPFDLALQPEERTIIVSGPNTGGKTVLLKGVGLLAALTQSGIVPPLGEGSALPTFRRIFADVGDHQSIAANLSTFSAHLRALRDILGHADSASLVLVDEVGSGTDPAEGAALAAAVLASLTRRGTLTLATTHLGALKRLPDRLPQVVNASLQFDPASLRPTYQFRKGVPGRSYGLAIGRQLGLDPAVLAEAEADLPEAERALDALLATVEARDQELRLRAATLAEAEGDLERRGAVLSRAEAGVAEREAALREGERTAERRAREQARAYLLEARRRVEEALGVARAAVDEATAREARRLIEDGVEAEAAALARVEGPEATEPVGDGATEVGATVRTRDGLRGEVLERRGDGRVVLLVGAVRMVVELERIEGTVSRRSATPVPPATTVPEVSAELEIDLRGLNGEEAEAAVLGAVDRAVRAEQPYLRIIHGKGTGVLRERVQRVLEHDRRVRTFGFAAPADGGTGVTIAEFTA